MSEQQPDGVTAAPEATTEMQVEPQPELAEQPDTAPVSEPAADELAAVTAELRRLRAHRTVRPSQAALIVFGALLLGALIAPLLWLGGKTPAGTVSSADPAVAALQAYERTLDGSKPTAGDTAAITKFVHVRTTSTGDTLATARSAGGACYELRIPAVGSAEQTAPGIRTAAATDCP